MNDRRDKDSHDADQASQPETDDETRAWHQRLMLPASHQLTVTGRKCETRRGSRYESRWLQQLDDCQRPVARYRTWTRQSLSPPYRRQEGWERYSPTGELMDREIRFSRRSDSAYLH